MAVVHSRCHYDPADAMPDKGIVIAAAKGLAQMDREMKSPAGGFKTVDNGMSRVDAIGGDADSALDMALCACLIRRMLKDIGNLFPFSVRLFIGEAADFAGEGAAIRYDIVCRSSGNGTDIDGGITDTAARNP